MDLLMLEEGFEAGERLAALAREAVISGPTNLIFDDVGEL